MQVTIVAPAAASVLPTPSIAPAAEPFIGPPVTGAPLSVRAALAPGTVAVITPPTYGNASLPGELPLPPLLASFIAPYLGASIIAIPHVLHLNPAVNLAWSGRNSLKSP